ncbi:MAG TPA: flagellar basal body-associated protein FliL [Clostridiaceae bacterium]|nr:flagellar basal body-associated protein FliL [Clostridiaceae bacterium]HHV99048.1 flagellar basal body-associated protein FliL [Clostridiaceae bacterium]
MESRSSHVILLVIIAFLTLTLAVLVGYIFLVSDSGSSSNISEVNSEEQKIKDQDLSVINLFDGDNFFNLKSENKLSIIQISAQLKYKKSVKGIKNVDEKINFNLGKIRELFGTYFQNLTIEDVKSPDAKEKANKELVSIINEHLLANEKYKEDIVYEIIFDKWFYQP